jgi:hypothetical protein
MQWNTKNDQKGHKFFLLKTRAPSHVHSLGHMLETGSNLPPDLVADNFPILTERRVLIPDDFAILTER